LHTGRFPALLAVVPTESRMKKSHAVETPPPAPVSPPAFSLSPRTALTALILVVFAYQVGVTVVAHEPWRDEAQAWLYARDAGLGELIADLRFEAHPILWYLILMPFAKAGVSFAAMQAIHYLIVVAFTALFLFRAPLPLWFKTLCVFSFYFFWQYAIEMRVYAIGILLMFVVASMYERRFERPVRYAIAVFLMSNTNVHMLLVGGALAGAYALELLMGRSFERRRTVALAVMSAGVLLCALQVGLIGGGTTHKYVYNLNEVHKFVVGAFFVGVGPTEALMYGAYALLAILLFPLLTRPVPLLIVALIIAANFGIALYKGSGLRHYGMVLLTLLWGYWIAERDRDRPALFARWPDFPAYAQRIRIALVALAAPLIVCMPLGWRMHELDRRLDYSGTGRMAAYLKQNDILRHPIAIHRYWHLSSLPLYLPGVQFWNVALDRRVTFVRQDQASIDAHAMPYETAIRRALEATPPPGPLYVLLDVPADLSSAGFQLIYKVDDTVFGSDERCYLYRRR
jgi:hypothetical protein